jgi:predicted PurR-regulated permease PerM
LLTAILAGLGTVGWAVSDDADALIETLPEVAQKLRRALEKKGEKSSPSTLEKVQQAATEIERATVESALPTTASGAASGIASGVVPAASGTRSRRAASAPAAAAAAGQVEPMPTTLPPTPPGVTRVVVEKPRINIQDYLWSGTLGLITLAGQATLVVFITFFLLASGTTFRRKMVKIAGPRLSQKKITVQALDEVHEQMQRYLFVTMATSVVVGILSGLAFYALGLNHALVWGILAGVTNLVPYLGAVLVGIASTALGIVQFESLDRGLYIGAASFAIHTLVGNLLTPWWMGRASRMSAFAVFVGVLLFGWLWGIWGLLLGMPILMVVKSVCDRVEELKPVGELLGA